MVGLVLLFTPLLYLNDQADYRAQQQALAEYHQSLKSDLADIKTEVKKLQEVVGRSRIGSGPGAATR
jgi:hypothetical protein